MERETETNPQSLAVPSCPFPITCFTSIAPYTSPACTFYPSTKSYNSSEYISPTRPTLSRLVSSNNLDLHSTSTSIDDSYTLLRYTRLSGDGQANLLNLSSFFPAPTNPFSKPPYLQNDGLHYSLTEHLPHRPLPHTLIIPDRESLEN